MQYISIVFKVCVMVVVVVVGVGLFVDGGYR